MNVRPAVLTRRLVLTAAVLSRVSAAPLVTVTAAVLEVLARLPLPLNVKLTPVVDKEVAPVYVFAFVKTKPPSTGVPASVSAKLELPEITPLKVRAFVELSIQVWDAPMPTAVPKMLAAGHVLLDNTASPNRENGAAAVVNRHDACLVGQEIQTGNRRIDGHHVGQLRGDR